ncbi:MAG: DUF58 domain-containing protein [Nitrososphaerales archaeon]
MLILFVAFDLRRPLPSESRGRFGAIRRAPEKAFVGETVLVELTLSNLGDDIERLHLDDGPPNSAQIVRGTISFDSSIRRNSDVTLRYELVFREPGEFNFGTTSVRLRSVFGLSERSFIFYAPFSLRVYPKLLTPKLSPLRARAFGWAGVTPSPYRGGRLEFMNIRGFATGDRMRDVNWKASARLGKKLVNEWQVERGLDCIVIVDLFSDDVPKVGEWSARGDVIEAAHELTTSFMTSGNRVGMLIMGRLLYKVKPGFGIARLRAMVEGMVDSQEGGLWNLEHVKEFLEEFFRKQYVGRGGTLFLVSAGANMRLVNAVASLSRRGFVCNTVVVDILKSEGFALAERKLMTAREAEFGSRFARAELNWFEGRLAPYSNVFEWNREHGLVELRRART